MPEHENLLKENGYVYMMAESVCPHLKLSQYFYLAILQYKIKFVYKKKKASKPVESAGYKQVPVGPELRGGFSVRIGRARALHPSSPNRCFLPYAPPGL